MSDKMFPLSIPELLTWIGGEKEKYNSIFQIPFERIIPREKITPVRLLGKKCALPIGPAAGPHTQLSQNLVTAYLCGARFFELKTVQKLDSLEFAKPCIDARDECYNTEWSTELSLHEAFTEYASAWIIIHLLETVLFGQSKSDFIFNMSVGYDLAGIKTAGMQQFIDGLIDAKTHPLWQNLLDSTKKYFRQAEVPNFWLPIKNDISDKLEKISTKISSSVTLSTMHGCPPGEIEDIAAYLMREKTLHTYVKLNPTLLGYDLVSDILQRNGFDYLELDEQAFGKDLQFKDAIPMLNRLQDLAATENLEFGVKLSNTLAVKNSDDILPGEDKYMSGRSLFPLTMRLALEIDNAFSGAMKISYSGGAKADNIVSIFESGIFPITVATDLLKPGGYLRLADMADKIERSNIIPPATIKNENLRSLTKSGVGQKKYMKITQMPLRPYPATKLSAFDCYEAPCVSACPIHQDIPRYIELAGKGEYEKALEVIYDKNPLPNITGYICDHQCEFHCTRNDYENPLAIREVKRIVAEKGNARKEKNNLFPEANKLPAVAVIGAGPAGLSAAYFLLRNGFNVTVFEQEKDAGGVVKQVLPHFRLPEKALADDVDFIRDMGAEFKFSASMELIHVNKLKESGFEYIFFAIGASKTRSLSFSIPNEKSIEALDFLRKFKKNPSFINPGENIIVIGGGNTAMDSSRAAKKLPGVKKVKIVYRRGIKELPADREEYEMALADGVEFHPHLNPHQFEDDNSMVFEKMEMGPPDDSGRARPIGTGNFEKIPADLVITAIGELVDGNVLQNAGIEINSPMSRETNIENVFIGGDARTGPATVVEAIADARSVVEEICKRENIKSLSVSFESDFARPNIIDLKNNRGKLFEKEIDANHSKFETKEAQRCLHCDYLCNKCVEVCPNRANITIASPRGFSNPFQIVHLDDLCNECGNCATFCPHNGRPYRDKLTIFSSEERFLKSENPGFFIIRKDDGRKSGQLRWAGQLFSINITDHTIHLKCSVDFALPGEDENKLHALLETIIVEHDWLVSSDESH